MALVSIIVPVFNSHDYLKECINSVISQTFRDIEIIIINDGSTDDSEKIVKEFIKMDSRIFYMRRDNKGISFTRNQGIQLATGKYIMFLDSDDYLEKNACQALVECIEATNADMVVCDFYQGDEQKTEVVKLKQFGGTNLQQCPNMIFDINSSPWNKIYSKRFLLENNITFPVGLKYEDAYFVLKAIARASKICQVNSPLIHYRVHLGSETTVMNEHVFDIFEILKMINTEFENEDHQEILDYVEFFNINRLTVYNLQQIYQKDKELAKKFVDESFAFLNKNFPHWSKNKMFISHNHILKRMIKTNKMLTLKYVQLFGKKDR